MTSQPSLFDDPPAPPGPSAARPGRHQTSETPRVGPSIPSTVLQDLAAALRTRFGEDRLFLGTSSWSFLGWRVLVWDPRAYTEDQLARHGLNAYAAHPLFNAVSLDRTFYRPLDTAGYARRAAQVPASFRFVVKAPAEITDASLRAPGTGAPLGPNPQFALNVARRPAIEGLGGRFGALVFQLSPLDARWLREPAALLHRLAALWEAIVPSLPAGTVAALELRDARALSPMLLQQLDAHAVRYGIGLHERMPAMADQWDLMRAHARGDLLCRWSLHQGLQHQQAKAQWAPFDRLQAPDPETRKALARAVVATLDQGDRAFVTINNKAEGSALLSVIELAKTILQQAGA